MEKINRYSKKKVERPEKQEKTFGKLNEEMLVDEQRTHMVIRGSAAADRWLEGLCTVEYTPYTFIQLKSTVRKSGKGCRDDKWGEKSGR